jgi:RHS repeat-associated protein
LTSFAGLTFSYDNEGQTATQGSTTYGFDYEHRLIAAPGVTYSYDGSGNRLKAIPYGAETHYVYDASGNLLAETNNANVITRYYIYGAGLLATVDATTGNIYCYHFNATGNTIALTDGSQTIVNRYAYTPFGVVTEQQTVNQPFKYVGQYGVTTEPSGLNYMKARYYDPTVGRFISEDPSGFGGGQVNLYAYAANNPISYVDPLGLEAQADDGAFLGIAAIFFPEVAEAQKGVSVIQNAWQSLLDTLGNERGGGFGGGSNTGGGSIMLGRFGEHFESLKALAEQYNARVLDQPIPPSQLESVIKNEIDNAEEIFLRIKDVEPGTFTYDVELDYIGSKNELLDKVRAIIDE